MSCREEGDQEATFHVHTVPWLQLAFVYFNHPPLPSLDYPDPQTEPRMNVQRVLRVFSPEFHEYRIYRVYTLPSLLLEVMTYSRIIVIAPQQTSEFIQCCSSGCVFTIDLLGGDNLSEDHSCRRLILPLSAAINCRSILARGKHCHTSHIHDTCQLVWSLCRCYLGGPYC